MSEPNLFQYTTGPRDAQILIVGESLSHEEKMLGRPFTSLLNNEFLRILSEGRVQAANCLFVTLLPDRPPGGKMVALVEEKSKTKPDVRGLYPTEVLTAAVDRLIKLVRSTRPRLIIAVGSWPLWALSHIKEVRQSEDIRGRLEPNGAYRYRGSQLVTRSDVDPERQIPLLPILTPGEVNRRWALRPLVVHDLRMRVPPALNDTWSGRKLMLRFKPTFAEAISFFNSIETRLSYSDVWLACDIETRQRIITCIGFADSETSALVVPFVQKNAKGASEMFSSYWPREQEVELTKRMRRILRHPRIKLIGQNFAYDMTYIHIYYGVVATPAHDTMGAQHLMFPGTDKSLAHLSTIYCSHHVFWKDDNKEWDAKENTDDHLQYNAVDCIRTFEIAMRQLEVLSARKLNALWAEELEKHEMAFEMSRRGVRIDYARRAKLDADLTAERANRINWLLKIVPQKIVDDMLGKPQKISWPTSAAQQKIVFYELFGLKAQLHRKTGNVTLDKEALPKLKRQAPYLARVFDTLLELRSIAVFLSTFVKAELDPDGRMRTFFQVFGPETFRWSSQENPFRTGCNFQNLPEGNER